MGSELRFRGVEVPSHVESIWSALALIDNPEVIKQIHSIILKQELNILLLIIMQLLNQS